MVEWYTKTLLENSVHLYSLWEMTNTLQWSPRIFQYRLKLQEEEIRKERQKTKREGTRKEGKRILKTERVKMREKRIWNKKVKKRRENGNRRD